MMKRLSLFFYAVLLMLGCCTTPRILAEYKSVDYPCSPTWHSCGNFGCCPNGYRCSTPEQEMAAGTPPFCEYTGQ